MFGQAKKNEIMIERQSNLEREIVREQEEKRETQLKIQYYLISALIVVVGIIFIVFAKIDITFVCKVLSAVFAIAGTVSVISYCVKDVSTGFYRLDLVYGIMALFAALVFITKHDVISVYFPVIAGFILFADGVIKLQHSIDMKRIDRKLKKVNEMWLVVMIFALMCITSGVVAVYMKPSEDRTLFLFVGIALVAAGITDVFTNAFFGKKIKIFKNTDLSAVEEEGNTSKENAEEKPDDTAGDKKEESDDTGDEIKEETKEETEEVKEEIVPEETVEDAVDPEA